MLLAGRAPWPHVASRLLDRDGLRACVARSVLKLEGVQDEVIVDMMLRHVSASPIPDHWVPAELRRPRPAAGALPCTGGSRYN